MSLVGLMSASSRRTIAVLGLAAVFGVAPVASAQDAPAAPAADQQQPQQEKDLFKFSSDAAVIMWNVKPDQTSTFESVWATIKARLDSTDKPDLKSLGDNLKMYKLLSDPGPNGVVYVFVADPASKTVSYSPSPFLLFESGLFEDAEARDLLEKLSNSLTPGAGISPVPAAPISAAPMAPAAPAAPAAPEGGMPSQPAAPPAQ